MPDPIEEPDPSASAEPPATPCHHLRSKGMYVYTDALGSEAHDDYDNTIYWCQRTLKDFGPDDSPVGGQDCRNLARSCYEAP